MTLFLTTHDLTDFIPIGKVKSAGPVVFLLKYVWRMCKQLVDVILPKFLQFSALAKKTDKDLYIYAKLCCP